MRAYVVWFTGIICYAFAILQRTSLGVAGAEAVDRFHAPTGVVSTFVVVQLLVYAGMQIPAGLLLDRIGSRRIITIGAIIMAAGQLLMAVATGLPAAFLARILVGAGDAMAFSAAIRLVPAWFPSHRVPVITQLTGILGQMGQILSAFPFVWLLHGESWSAAFGAAAGCAALGAVLAATLLRDRPAGSPIEEETPDPISVWRQLAEVWRVPGARLAMWTHFTTSVASVSFSMLWGFSYLTQGEHLAQPVASTLLSVFAIIGALFGPIFGVLTGHHPLRRSNIVLTVVLATSLPWIVVILWPGPAPLWLLIVLTLLIATGGPGSAVGFDFARTFNAPRNLGTATGLTITGGFVAGLVAILGAGLTLDWATARGIGGGSPAEPSLLSYRLAMSFQLVVILIGVVGILVSRRKTRRRMAEEGTIVPSWPDALRRERARRQSRRP